MLPFDSDISLISLCCLLIPSLLPDIITRLAARAKAADHEDLEHEGAKKNEEREGVCGGMVSSRFSRFVPSRTFVTP
jgi:hypothetical protein